jgi:uncharacterized membrane protein YphA (DoxX/SURF4 family)
MQRGVRREEEDEMSNQRRANTALVWALSVLLAIVFLGAGIPKLLGTSTMGLQAAAMRGFPGWLREVVGVAEIAGALALLVPSVAAYAAVGLAVLMVPATITQVMSGEPGVYVPIGLFVLLLGLAWRRNPEAIRTAVAGILKAPHPVLREGVVAGAIGATCIAVWFFIVDLVAGRPLFTPLTLGRALFSVLRPTPSGFGDFGPILGYTVFHYAAFIAVGFVAAVAARIANHEPSVLLGFAVLFAAFEVGFYALVALLQQASALGTLAWYQVMAGNIIAAAAMGAYMVRVHPLIRQQLAHAFDQQAPSPNHRKVPGLTS